jgi:hypothetical protein
MHTINVRKIDDKLFKELKKESQKNGISMNSLVLNILRKNLIEKTVAFHDLDRFFGTWNEETSSNVKEVLSDSRKIDEELWV